MKRRTLLKRTGALLASGAVAGCLADVSSDDPGAGGDGDNTNTPTDETSSGGDSTENPSPELQSRSVETGETGCGSENTATVEFDDEAETVNLQGSIATSNPCHVATIQRARYDQESGTLVAVVGAEADGSDGCMQCLGQVSYTASFQFAGGLPNSVEVRHTSRGETTTVATESQ